MKNLKVKMSVLALLIGLGSAFASVRRDDPTDKKWSRDAATGEYTDITGQQLGTDYLCDPGSAVCTATYPDGQNPNLNESGAISVEHGAFK